MDGHPLRTYRHAPNTGPRKGWAGGDAASRAVAIALLVQRGQPGAPAALTAPRWGFYDATFKGQELKFHRPFGTWVMENIFFKLVPAEGHAISALEAALKVHPLLKERGLDVDRDIERIRLRTHAGAILIISKSGPLQNAADRDHCLQYMLAVTLLKGSLVEYPDYQDTSPWPTDSRVDRLREKIELVEEPRFSREYLDVDKRSAANGLKIYLTGGREMDEVVVEYPLGHASRPETIPAVETKVQRNLGRSFSPDRVERIIKAVKEDQSMAVDEFVNLLAKPDVAVASKL